MGVAERPGQPRGNRRKSARMPVWRLMSTLRGPSGRPRMPRTPHRPNRSRGKIAKSERRAVVLFATRTGCGRPRHGRRPHRTDHLAVAKPHAALLVQRAVARLLHRQARRLVVGAQDGRRAVPCAAGTSSSAPSASLFGSTELVMRIPVTVFLPITCVLLMPLARRWMSLVPAVVVALVGGLTGTLVSFAVQLSEYQIDAAAVVAVLLLYDVAASRDRSRWGTCRCGSPTGVSHWPASSARPPSSSPGQSFSSMCFARRGTGLSEPGRWQRWPPARSRSCTSSSSLRHRTHSPRATTGIRTLRPIMGCRVDRVRVGRPPGIHHRHALGRQQPKPPRTVEHPVVLAGESHLRPAAVRRDRRNGGFAEGSDASRGDRRFARRDPDRLLRPLLALRLRADEFLSRPSSDPAGRCVVRRPQIDACGGVVVPHRGRSGLRTTIRSRSFSGHGGQRAGQAG